MTAPGVAFFDLDRTVLSVNSATGWVRRELRLGHVPLIEAFKAALWIGRYQLGFAQMDDAIRDAIRSLQGEDEAPIRGRTMDFWREQLVQAIRPGARAAIARHQSAGELCVLLTSSSLYLSQAATAELGLDGYLCNVFEVQDGVFTGGIHEPLCFGPGKISYARDYAKSQGVTLDRCAFYTDSFSDLPLMEAVGRPVAVAPDPRLARECRKRGWSVEDWNLVDEAVSVPG